ncbi:F-box only protein 7-like [Asterias rubens]|uniref:F-box only protein 7-like n=1 Tax=Asterias rubens TaxID=7604 RepID=UPI001455743F|nr:F-box only protein 7-like [Asterias rubens]
MKLRVRLEGRTQRVEFDTDPTIDAVKGTVASLFGHDVATFELSLNGREALHGDPETPLSHFDIVSGDLIRIIRTHEGAVQSSGFSNNPTSILPSRAEGAPKVSSPDPVRMEVEEEDRRSLNAQRELKETSETNRTTEMPKSQPSASWRTPGQGGHVMEEVRDEEDTLPRAVKEPMLCRSATDCLIPQRLKVLSLENRPKSLNEALCIVLHVLMLETGFHAEILKHCSICSSLNSSADPSQSTPSSSDDQTEDVLAVVHDDISANMPHGWRVNGVHKLTYHHPACEGAVCCVACVPVGSLLAIHGVTSGKARFNLQLKPSDYVTTVDDAQPRYTNLPQVSRLYKDAVAYPLLLTTRSELGLVPLNGLLGLVPEVQLLILSYLDATSLLNIAEVCQHFYNMAADMSLWRQLLLRDFGCRDSDSNLDWKELYKQKYKNKKDLERYRRNLMDRSLPVRPGVFFPPQPLFPTMPGYPSGYRGGNYDLDPFAGLGQPHDIPIRRDPTIGPFSRQPDIVPFPEQAPGRDPLLNPLPRVPNRRDPLGGSRGHRSGGNNRGFFF